MDTITMNEITDTTETIVSEDTPLNYIAENIFNHSGSQTSNLLNLAILACIALFFYAIARVLTSILVQRLKKENTATNFLLFALSNIKIFKNLTLIIPWLVFQSGLPLLPNLEANIRTILYNLCSALIIFFAVRSITNFLHTIVEYTEKKNTARNYKSLIQLASLALHILGAILIIAVLIDRSPAILISGLGAMSAVTMLIFKDTITSFVAGAQITSNNLIKVGDWIEMPQAGADGTVIDIALHVVRIQNFDKTIIAIPTWKLVSESYKNYRGMYEVNARRIKRSIDIDVRSIKFMTSTDVERLSHVNVLRNYIKDKRVEVENHNKHISENTEMDLNRRRLTNVGTFRAYALAYLRAHPNIRKDLSLMVRQLQPSASGLPLEVYCFTNTTIWADYEGIQSDIFDHLYSVMPDFGLRPYQQPSGYDVVYSFSPENTRLNLKNESSSTTLPADPATQKQNT